MVSESSLTKAMAKGGSSVSVGSERWIIEELSLLCKNFDPENSTSKRKQ